MNDDDKEFDFSKYFSSDAMKHALKTLEEFDPETWGDWQQWVDDNGVTRVTYDIETEPKKKQETAPICPDHNDDCKKIKNHSVCWAASPDRGYCPLMYKVNIENIK